MQLAPVSPLSLYAIVPELPAAGALASLASAVKDTMRIACNL